MTFLLRTRTTSPEGEVYERALEDWRRQATLVADLWETYQAANREGQALAFRAYTAALDAEEAAASELAGLSPAKGA
jgi:hypothetical protein